MKTPPFAPAKTPALVGLLLCAATATAAVPVPDSPDFKSGAYLLMDYATGAVLAENNADTPLQPASLTKIMTAYIAFYEIKAGRLGLEQQAAVSEKAWKTRGSRMFIEVGNRVSIKDLLSGLVVQSGNDASVALAEHIAGSEQAFVDMMNAHAARLGMRGSRFMNATGWPSPGHVTTARDMAILSRAMITEFPALYRLHAVKSFEHNNIKQYNRNTLLWRDGAVDGIKTGYTRAAGYCLAASAAKRGMRLIAVILGAPSERARAAASLQLLDYGFRFYETRQIYHAGEEVVKGRVWKGEKPDLSIGVAAALVVTVPRGDHVTVGAPRHNPQGAQQAMPLHAELEYDKNIIAPVRRGMAVGKVVVTLADEAVAESPLVALEDVGEGGLLRRMLDSLRLLGRS